jgi:hypothetical protein
MGIAASMPKPGESYKALKYKGIARKIPAKGEQEASYNRQQWTNKTRHSRTKTHDDRNKT